MTTQMSARTSGPRHPLRDVVLACMLVLLLSQAMIGALSLSALNDLTTDNTAKRVAVLASSAAARIENGMRLGKPLAQFFGLRDILTNLQNTIPDLQGASVVLANGQHVQNVGEAIRVDALLAALQSDAPHDESIRRSASGTVYRTGADAITVAVPLTTAADTLAGVLVLSVRQSGTGLGGLLGSNLWVLTAVTLAAALVLSLFFRFVIPVYQVAAAGR